MSTPRAYITSYLNGKGAVVKGAAIVSKRPKQMAPASDVTGMLRRSFKASGSRSAKTR
ncbi:MAG TPA: hypothetical protein VIJ39_05885 [Solirubrobacteraceae bacterium]